MAFFDALRNLFGGTPAQTQQIPNYPPEQQQQFQGNLGQLNSASFKGLMDILQGTGAGNFEPIEAKARNEFQQYGTPTIAERFTQLGGENRLGSSGFKGEANRGQREFELGLGALKSQHGLQQAGQRQNLLTNLFQTSLTPLSNTGYLQRQPGFAEEVGVPLAQGVSQALPILLSLLLGGATGGTAPAVASAGAAALPTIMKLLAYLSSKGQQ